MKRILSLIFLLSVVCSSFAQKRKIQIISTDKMVGDRIVRKLYGNVTFKHKNALMYCDSAYFYAKDNRFIAFSNVRIVDKTVLITADTMYYNSIQSRGKLRGEVKLVDGDTELTTNYLNYKTKDRIGYYYNNGNIKDKENNLSSERGYYYANTNELFFKNDVKLINKDYKIITDTLKYHTPSETSYFYGPSYIYGNDNTLYTENGWYKSKERISQFYQNSYVKTGSNYIAGNDLFYDQNTKKGLAKGNVVLKDSVEKIALHCDYAKYDGKLNNAFATGNILMIQEFENDSLFMHSDSILVNTYHNVTKDSLGVDSTEYQIIRVFNKVRFFKNDIQGVCDSLVYNSLDSIITLYTAPVIWSEENQITGKEIVLELIDNKLSRIKIDAKAFVVSQDNKTQFNQMKGVSLTGYVKDNNLYRIDIENEGETIYYLKDKVETIGVNIAKCDSITLHILSGKANQIVFKNQPTGTLHPPTGLPKKSQTLAGFIWLDYIRPQDKSDIFIWREIKP